MRYVFGDFVLDCDTRQLLRAGAAIPVSPKAFLLLELLLRSRPRAVSRTLICSALWPHTHVGPTSLHVLISQVRAALDDDVEAPRWLRTLPRFGYAFAGKASEAPAVEDAAGGDQAAPRLLVDGREAVLREGENLIGREPGLTVRVDTPGVSRQHARIVVTGAEVVIEDLGSKNGTFVGEDRLTAPRPLRDGDVVHLGRRVRLLFSAAPASTNPTETEPPS